MPDPPNIFGGTLHRIVSRGKRRSFQAGMP